MRVMYIYIQTYIVSSLTVYLNTKFIIQQSNAIAVKDLNRVVQTDVCYTLRSNISRKRCNMNY